MIRWRRNGVAWGRFGAHNDAMKKPRVKIEKDVSYRIVVEQSGQKRTVALAGDPKQAKRYAREFEIEYGLRQPKKKAKPEK